MCAAFADLSRNSGYSVAQIAVPDPGTYPPFWPISRLTKLILDPFAGDERDAVRASMPRSSQASLERLLDDPELRPDSGGPPHRASWFALVEAVAAVVRWAARQRPLAVFIDDAHRLDDSSAYAFQELGKDLSDTSITVVVTVREPAGETRSSARRAVDEYRLSPRVRELRLGPLPRPATAELSEKHGYHGSESVLDEIHRISGGNPLFLAVLVERLSVGAFDLSDPASHLGPIVRREVARLPEDAAELIRTAAVLGTEFSVFELSLACEESPSVFTAISQAEASGIIRSHDHRDGSLVFRHQAVRDAVLAGLSESERVRRAEDIAWRLHRGFGQQAEQHAEKLSDLFSRGFSTDAQRQAIHYAVLAADRSARALAWEEAFSIADRLLTELGPMLRESQEMECYRLRGTARYMTGDSRRAVDDLYEAFQRYMAAGLTDRIPGILTTFSYLDVGDAKIEEMAGRAMELYPADSPAGIIAAIYHAATVHHGLGDYDRAARLLEELLPRVDAQSDQNLIAALHSFYCQSLMIRRRFEEVPYHLSFEPSPGGGVPDARVYHNFAWAEYLLHQGKPQGTRAYHEASVLICREGGDDSLRGPAYQLAARGALRQGDWSAAKDLGLKALRYNRHATGAHMPLVAACYHLGNIGEGDEYMESLKAVADDTPPGRGTSHTTFATMAALRRITTGDLGYTSEARRFAHAVLAPERPHPQIGIRAGYALAELAHADWVTGGRFDERDVAEAERSLSAFSRFSSLHDHYIRYAYGLLSRCRGDAAAAREALEESVAYADELADAAARAWTRTRLGAVLEATAPGRAIEVFQEAYAAASSFGMKPLIGYLEQHLLLSPREMDTLRYVARGLQAKEIAGILNISTSTVQNHIQQIFTKTKTGNRVEAVRWARAAGILADTQ